MSLGKARYLEECSWGYQLREALQPFRTMPPEKEDVVQSDAVTTSSA